MHEVRRSIAADADKVWTVIADPTTYPTWLVGAQKVKAVDGDFPAPGSGFQHRSGLNDTVAISDSSTSLAAEPGRTLALKVRARPFFDGIVRFRLVPVKGGTEVVLDETPVGPLKVLSPLMGPFLNARNARSLENLRGVVEGPGSSPAQG